VTRGESTRLSGSDDSKSNDGANHGDTHKTHDAVEVSPPASLEILALQVPVPHLDLQALRVVAFLAFEFGDVLQGLGIGHDGLHGSMRQGEEGGHHPEEWAQETKAEEEDLAVAARQDESVQSFVEAGSAPGGEAVGKAARRCEVRRCVEHVASGKRLRIVGRGVCLIAGYRASRIYCLLPARWLESWYGVVPAVARDRCNDHAVRRA